MKEDPRSGRFFWMPFRTFRLPVESTPEQAETLNTFLRGRSVVVVRKEWVAAGEASFWAFCVEYQEQGAGAGGGRSGAASRVDYKEVLNAEQFAVFARLRDLRKILAERDGVPVFAVFTNAQLAEMVRMPVRTAADLARIDGVGEARMGKYGKEVLAEIGKMPKEGKGDEAGEGTV